MLKTAKPNVLTAMLLTGAITSFASGQEKPSRATDRQASEQAPFAVVELFTSEGCSSCPPADMVASEIIAEAEASGANVYVLSHHVHYWDRLGWPDRFASPNATARQYRYSNVLDDSRVYTPQMIINGAEGFVGSDASRAKRLIAEQLKSPAAASILMDTSVDAGEVSVSARVADNRKAKSEYVVVVALVQDDLESKVTRGENAGRTLGHRGVVRTFAEMPAGTDGTIKAKLAVPADADHEHLNVIAFAQEARSMRIFGALAMPFPVSEASD